MTGLLNMRFVKLGVLGAFVSILLLAVGTLMMLIVSSIFVLFLLIGRLLVSLHITVLRHALSVVGLPCPLLLCRVGCSKGLPWIASGVIVPRLVPGITSLGLVLLDLLLCLGRPGVVWLGGGGLCVASLLMKGVLCTHG